MAGVLSFVLVFAFLSIVGNTYYPFDSGFYYRFSLVFAGDEGFSLRSFPYTLRGIVFPLMLLPFNQIAQIIWGDTLRGWYLFISSFSAVFSMLFPFVFKGLGKANNIVIPLLLQIMVYFGLFLVPLVDLVALWMLIFSLAFIKIAYTYVERRGLQKRYLVLFVLSGATFYISYNTRTIYQFAIFGMILILITNIRLLKHKAQNVAIVLAFVIGVFSIAGVQIYSNMHTIDSFSISPAQTHYRGLPLNHFQLQVGMGVNLYETSLVENEGLAVSYTNHSGNLVLRELGHPQLGSLSDYLSWVFAFPIEFIGVYMRHLIVMLNPISGGGYVYFRNNSRFILTMLNYTMLFVATCYIKRNMLDLSLSEIKGKFKSISNDAKNSVLSIFTILLPFIAITPGAVEERFGLPFWIVIYGLFCYCINLKEEFEYFKKRWLSYVLIYLFTFGVFIAILTEIYASNTSGVFLPILDLSSFFNR